MKQAVQKKTTDLTKISIERLFRIRYLIFLLLFLFEACRANCGCP